MLLRRHVGLPEDDQRRSRLRLPQSFHRGQRYRLIARQHAALRIARRNNLEHANKQCGDHAYAHENRPCSTCFSLSR